MTALVGLTRNGAIMKKPSTQYHWTNRAYVTQSGLPWMKDETAVSLPVQIAVVELEEPLEAKPAASLWQMLEMDGPHLARMEEFVYIRGALARQG